MLRGQPQRLPTQSWVGKRCTGLSKGSMRFKVAHADGSVAWRELADMSEHFDRLAWPLKVRAKLLWTQRHSLVRLVNVTLDGDSVLIEGEVVTVP